LNESFAQALGKNLDNLQEEGEKKKWDNQAWATALALTFIQEKLKDLKDSWELVAMKAKKWLEINYSEELDSLIAAAKDLIAQD